MNHFALLFPFFFILFYEFIIIVSQWLSSKAIFLNHIEAMMEVPTQKDYESQYICYKVQNYHIYFGNIVVLIHNFFALLHKAGFKHFPNLALIMKNDNAELVDIELVLN